MKVLLKKSQQWLTSSWLEEGGEVDVSSHGAPLPQQILEEIHGELDSHNELKKKHLW